MTDSGGFETAGLLRVADHLADASAVALTGAGMSTESGIPDYRGKPEAGRPRRGGRPMTYQEFVGSGAARARYWLRSMVGWPFMEERRPNAAHAALAGLQRSGAVGTIVTQNVDGLHQAAGSADVVELHGSLWRVRCLSCGAREARGEVQRRIAASNPQVADASFPSAPDGDAEVPEDLAREFVVPACNVCGGVLKPDVVFFGENVPAPIYEAARQAVADAGALLVLGSSLKVRSGFRFVAQAVAADKPVLVINDGPTRGDDLALVKVEARLGEALTRLSKLLD